MKTLTFKSTALIGAYLLTSCVSMSSLQSARTLKKGEWSFALGLGQESVKFKQKKTTGLEGEFQEVIEDISVPIVEFYTKYGLMEKLDLGLKFTSPASISTDLKYMLLGKGSPLSLALGAGYISTKYDTGSGDLKNEYEITDLFIPLYLSYDLSKSFSLHLVPRYQQRTSKQKGSTIFNETTKTTWYGSNVGFNWKWLILELGYFKDSKNTESMIQQITLGFWSGWDDLDR